MTEYWERSVVMGTKRGDDGYQVVQEFLHRRGEDPIVMACRRDKRMAGADRIEVFTVEAFMQIRKDEEEHKTRAEISRDRIDREQWDQ